MYPFSFLFSLPRSLAPSLARSTARMLRAPPSWGSRVLPAPLASSPSRVLHVCAAARMPDDGGNGQSPRKQPAQKKKPRSKPGHFPRVFPPWYEAVDDKPMERFPEFSKRLKPVLRAEGFITKQAVKDELQRRFKIHVKEYAMAVTHRRRTLGAMQRHATPRIVYPKPMNGAELTPERQLPPEKEPREPEFQSQPRAQPRRTNQPDDEGKQ